MSSIIEERFWFNEFFKWLFAIFNVETLTKKEFSPSSLSWNKTSDNQEVTLHVEGHCIPTVTFTACGRTLSCNKIDGQRPYIYKKKKIFQFLISTNQLVALVLHNDSLSWFQQFQIKNSLCVSPNTGKGFLLVDSV